MAVESLDHSEFAVLCQVDKGEYSGNVRVTPLSFQDLEEVKIE